MKDKIRFVHCSDVHLGCSNDIKDRFYDMGNAFRKVVNYIVENKDEIDFLVVAGDLFDKKSINAEILYQCIEILKPLNEINIPIYVTQGNHDMETYYNNFSWLKYLNKTNVIRLLNPVKAEDGTFKLKQYDEEGSYFIDNDLGVTIYGLGFFTITPGKYVERLSNDYIDNTNNHIVITLLHAGIEKFMQEGMGGMKSEEIKYISDKSDYIALGHIHTEYHYDELKYYNPGSLENTNIAKDSKEKGFYDVTIDRDTKNVDLNFIKVANRKCINLTIDLDNVKDAYVAYNEIINRVDGILKVNNVSKEDGALMQIKIKGQLESQGTNLKLDELENELKNKFGLLYVELQNKLVSKRDGMKIDIENFTREEIDKAAIKNLIIKNGFENDDVDTLLNITMKMKDLTLDGDLDLSSDGGKDIKELLKQFIISKNKLDNNYICDNDNEVNNIENNVENINEKIKE